MQPAEPPGGVPGDPTVFRDAFGGAPTPPPGGGPSRTPLLVAAVVALVLVVGAVGIGVVLHSKGGGSSPAPVAAPLSTSPAGSTTASAVSCSSPPTVTTSSATPGPGGLTVSVRASSGCQGGQVLAQRGTTVTLTDGAATVATGTLDLAATPVRLGSSGTTLNLVFPVGSYWIVPSSSTAAGTSVTLREPNGGTPSTATPTTTPSTIRVSGGGVSPQQAESYATAALRRQADIDKPDVLARLAEQWEPQLSSKKNGLVADGTTYDDQAVLADHLALRARYPQARLLYSGEWQNYSRADFWVTVSGTTTAGPDSSLSWCAAQGLDRDHCLAAFVSTRVGPDGTSKLQ